MIDKRRTINDKRSHGQQDCASRVSSPRDRRSIVHRLSFLVYPILLAGCHTDMWTQPKALPQQESDVLPNGQVSQLPVEGTIARGRLRENEAFFTGYENGKIVKEIPATLVIDGQTLSTKTDLQKILKRGQDRFDIFCSHCHGGLGDGKGMIAKRGLELRRPPATYHTDRLREMPIGHFFDVQTKGYGAMFSYASRIEPNDRWAIAAYIRALQLSQNASDSDLPAGGPGGSGPEEGVH